MNHLHSDEPGYVRINPDQLQTTSLRIRIRMHYLLSLCLLYVVLGLITGFREGIGESDLTTSEA